MIEELRVGIVGCGAVTELAHLPALATAKNVRVTALIDRNRARAAEMAAKLGTPRVGTEVSDLFGKVDAVILAVPHVLHAPIAIELLNQRLHVYVEKPMALTAAECDQMIAAARQNDAILAVGLMRRFAPWARFTKQVLESGMLGPIVNFDWREGYVYHWPVASDFMFRKEAAGGGVLIDTGAHTLDALLWWLGDVAEFEYFDDAQGGVEADCEIHLTMASGATGIVELTRTRNLSNKIVIRGERATIEARPGEVTLIVDGYRVSGMAEPVGEASESDQYLDTITASLHDWLEAAWLGRLPRVTGEEARRSVALIEALYECRQPLIYPWCASANVEVNA